MTELRKTLVDNHAIDYLSEYRFMQIQCNLDLVTPNLVTNRDLVTILQKNIFLVHKNITCRDNWVFSATSI